MIAILDTTIRSDIDSWTAGNIPLFVVLSNLLYRIVSEIIWDAHLLFLILHIPKPEQVKKPKLQLELERPIMKPKQPKPVILSLMSRQVGAISHGTLNIDELEFEAECNGYIVIRHEGFTALWK